VKLTSFKNTFRCARDSHQKLFFTKIINQSFALRVLFLSKNKYFTIY